MAETGLTIATLRYVIDTGYENNKYFNPVYNFSGLIVMPSSQASTIQRKGRVGRVFAGTWYPMFTSNSFNSMITDKPPDITSSDISVILLGLIIKNKNITWDGLLKTPYIPTNAFDLTNLDLLTQPGYDTLTNALEKLYVLGFIDKHQNPTMYGLVASKLTKIKLECSRMILAGYKYGANIEDLITIAAFITNGINYKEVRTGKFFSFGVPSKKKLTRFLQDDFVETIFIWNSFVENLQLSAKSYNTDHIKQWCLDNGFIYSRLLAISAIRLSIITSFYQTIGLDPFYNGLNIKNYNLAKIFDNFGNGMEEVLKLKKCIYEGFRLNFAHWNDEKKTYMLNNNLPIKITSRATNYQGSVASSIVVDNIGFTNRQVKTKIYYLTAEYASVMIFYLIDNGFITS